MALQHLNKMFLLVNFIDDILEGVANMLGSAKKLMRSASNFLTIKRLLGQYMKKKR